MPESTPLNEQPRIAVLGAPGAGKSSLIGAGGQTDATLIECDGKEAQEVFTGALPLEQSGSIASEIRNADAVIVTLPPSDPRQTDQAFSQIAELLRRMEEQRGRRSDIAGLPVYVVLTKSDLLARKD